MHIHEVTIHTGNNEGVKLTVRANGTLVFSVNKAGAECFTRATVKKLFASMIEKGEQQLVDGNYSCCKE